ncbi:MAG: glycosyltransferase family 2 protein [Patescibacteria group bacterium]
MKVAIVVVSYNGLKYLDQVLGSCDKFAKGIPVYIVDNASVDGSVDYIVKNWPQVKLLAQNTNTGFAQGNNIGIKQAITDGAEAVFLLNQDAELEEGCLERLINFLDNNKPVGAVQPAIFLPNGLVNSLGNPFHYLGFGESGGSGLSLADALRRLPWFRKQTEIPYFSGAAVLIRSEALKQVGFFDEDLFMYHEDLELSFRLRLTGWKLEIDSNAGVIHHYEQSRSRQQMYFMERNRFIVWLSYFKITTLLILILPCLVSEVMLLLISIVNGWVLEKLKSYIYFFYISSWRNIWKRRIKLGKVRVVNDRYLLSYATSKIEFHDDGGWLTRNFFNPISTVVWFIIKPLILW